MKLAKFISSFALVAIISLSSIAAHAEDYVIRIKEHHFIPETLIVPTGEKIKLKIINEDPTAEEFESYDLNREKIIKGNSTGYVFIGPLKPGEYKFFGEFNMKTANGKVIAKDPSEISAPVKMDPMTGEPIK
jgi:hypothetical protein